MKLIKKIEPRRDIKGKLIKYGEFECPICLQEVEKRLDHGKNQKSCGCHKYIKHGGRYTRLYRIWKAMKQRILNPNYKEYKYYGGRGITICNEWLEFIPFRDWSLSNGYADNLTIDRIENDLGYSQNNCQWITQKENNRKKSTTKLNLEIANEIRGLHNTGNYLFKDLAEKYDISVGNIYDIITYKIWMMN